MTSNFLTQGGWRVYWIRKPPTCLCTTSNFLLKNTMVIMVEIVIIVDMLILVEMIIMVEMVIMVEMAIMVVMVIINIIVIRTDRTSW